MNLFTKDKHYNTLDNYYKHKYNQKVIKIALNADFTCPNKDGKKGYGGCSFCSKLGSGDCAGDKELPLREQFYQIKEIMEHKWPNSLYIPYLQANSNTYASVDKLKKIYYEVINYEREKTVGIAIATRSDAISEECYLLLNELNKEIPVQIELGLQSSNENTTKILNRCENNSEIITCVNRLRSYNISVVIHIINGLPNETTTDMLNTIEFVNKLDVQGIKIHSLLVLKDTLLAKQYKEKPFKIMSLEEYVDITVEQIRHLSSDIIIHRLAADGVTTDLITPEWSKKKMVVMNEIDKKMRNNDYYQGELYSTQ